MHALYAFARVADEIVDAPGRDGRAEHLARWRESFCVEVRAGRSADPVRWAAIHTARRWDIPVEHFETFLASMAMDLTTTSYPTYEDLLRYVQGSAAVIGLQMVPILGALDERAYPAAEALGIAFQLANFVRDLGEDLDRGRLYLPLADLERFDLARADLDRRCVDDRVRALLAFEIARVRRLEAAARPGIEALEPTSRPCIDAARILYCGIADEVERIDYQVFDQRARVSMTRRLAVAARAWTRARRISRATSAAPLEGFAGSRGDPRTPTG